MIVCTKRAFLNVLTQLMDANTLINANYFIADQCSSQGLATIGDSIDINDDGGYVIKAAVNSVHRSLHPYHIHYAPSQVLSPAGLSARVMADLTNASVEEMFKNSLLGVDGMIDTYNFLRMNKIRGNGLKIMIYTSDMSAEYLHIVCEYLSSLFGEDIIFLDKKYRNDIKGQVEYKGDRIKCKEVERTIRDWTLLRDLQNVASNYQYGYGDMNNILVYLSKYDMDELFYIHDLVFPYDHLPPGEYTKDHLEHVIVGKLVQSFPKVAGSNLNIDTLDDLIGLYDNVSDEELMSIHGE